MREIEFRAWDRLSNIIINNDELIRRKFNPLNEWVEFEKMQYTGLKDKNGVKIFEGDILFYHSSRKSGNVVVEYVMGTFSFDCIGKKQGWQLLGLYNQFCEVIGNKFENPELLNAE